MGILLEVTSGAMATLREEAARAFPREACGLLFGQNVLGQGVLGAGVRIERAVAAPNVHPEPLRHFEIDPAALIAAHRAAREGGPALLGYFHSHPQGPARLSAVDRAQAAGDGRVWAIVGTRIGGAAARGAAGGDVTFWRDGDGGFEALSSRVVDG